MNWLRVAVVIIIISLSAGNVILRNKVNRLDNELGIAKSNVEQYSSIVNGKSDENRVLQLTIDDFKQSNDSLVQRLSKMQDSLKIKDKQLKQAVGITTVLTDTLIEKVPIDRNFSVELKSNPLTTIKISRVDSVLTCIPEIYNHQDLLIYEQKVWRNKRKNLFQRLIHFDFKKDKIDKYQIINSNDKIQVLDTRIIRISE